MSDTLHAIYIHVIFGTKNRVPHLTRKLSPSLYAYIGGIVKNHDCSPLIVGGHPDHVHILARMGTNIDISELVKESKRVSALWLKQEELTPRTFSWQRGYAAFSVSSWDVDKIRQYIANQEEHHKEYNWRTEMRRFFKRYKIEEEEIRGSVWDQ